MTKLLAVIDYQNDFVSGALGFPGAEALEPGILARIKQTLSENNYVLFTQDTHPEKYLQTREGTHLPLPHCIQGTHGHALYGQLSTYQQTPHPHTMLLHKPTFGCADIGPKATALCGTPPDIVEICGLVTDICIIANAIILHTQLPNAHIRVLSSLVGSANTQAAECALQLLRGMGIEVS